MFTFKRKYDSGFSKVDIHLNTDCSLTHSLTRLDDNRDKQKRGRCEPL